MTKIMEINKLVFAFIRLSSDKNVVMRDVLLKDLNRVYLAGETSGYDVVLDFCHMLGMLRHDGDHVTITGSGIRYSILCSHEDEMVNLDPNPQQRKALLAMLLDSDEIMTGVVPLVDELCLDFASVPKSWFARSVECCPKDTLDFMEDIGFINHDGNVVRVHRNMSGVISMIKNRGRKTMSEEELTSLLQINKKIGDDAENLTMKFERNRLETEDLCDMAIAIQQISTVDVAAGYDILSFDGKTSSYQHDRRIEVKGTRGNGDMFFWSEGEIKAAKKFGKAYWIYFWRNVGNNNMEALEMINDPYDKFWRQSDTKPKPVVFRVECEPGEARNV